MRESSELAGKTVTINESVKGIGGQEYRVENWWQVVAGKSWMVCDGNPACLKFAARSAFADLPTDDEVLYGHTPDGLGHLIHISEVS